jgi:HAD superfamily hydrolase (TIGR01509 family)
MPPVVLLDFGGTLDSDGVHWLDRFYAIYARLAPDGPGRGAIREAFDAAGRDLQRDPTIRTCGLRELVERHVAAQGRTLGLADPRLAAEIVGAFVEPMERLLVRNRAILAALRRDRWRLGIVSNFHGNLRPICDAYGLTPHLDVLMDSAIVGIRKPDPALFARALRDIGCEPANAVFVGDSLDRDLRPAKSLGMRTVWLRDCLEKSCREDGLVDVVIGSLTDLADVVEPWRWAPSC